MAGAYSQDLRNPVIDAVAQDGMSRRAAAHRLEVSESAAVKWLQRYENTSNRKPVGTGGHRPSKLKPHRDFIVTALKDRTSRWRRLASAFWRNAA
jgi:transposase